MESKRKIWIDADPGGLTTQWRLPQPLPIGTGWIVLGISTVAGNQTSERVTGNALKLTVFLGAEDIPVVRGARAPLIREVVPAGDIHGKSGLGYCELPAVSKELAAENGILYMLEQIMGLPEGEKVTLVPIGPLTNIALLLKTFPEVKEKIEEIVLMGGAAVGGNVTPTAEFNIWEDPEAARIVFSSGISIVMCGLDVTRKCIMTREQIAALAASRGSVQNAYGQMLQFYLDSPSYRGCDGAAVHDAATILYLLHPELFSGRKMQVEIDCSEGLNRGMTVCDMRRSAISRPGDVLVPRRR